MKGDIELQPGQKNIQTDLSYRWPGAKLFVDVLPDVSTNVAGVLHQVIH